MHSPRKSSACAQHACNRARARTDAFLRARIALTLHGRKRTQRASSSQCKALGGGLRSEGSARSFDASFAPSAPFGTEAASVPASSHGRTPRLSQVTSVLNRARAGGCLRSRGSACLPTSAFAFSASSRTEAASVAWRSRSGRSQLSRYGGGLRALGEKRAARVRPTCSAGDAPAPKAQQPGACAFHRRCALTRDGAALRRQPPARTLRRLATARSEAARASLGQDVRGHEKGAPPSQAAPP